MKFESKKKLKFSARQAYLIVWKYYGQDMAERFLEYYYKPKPLPDGRFVLPPRPFWLEMPREVMWTYVFFRQEFSRGIAEKFYKSYFADFHQRDKYFREVEKQTDWNSIEIRKFLTLEQQEVYTHIHKYLGGEVAKKYAEQFVRNKPPKQSVKKSSGKLLLYPKNKNLPQVVKETYKFLYLKQSTKSAIEYYYNVENDLSLIK